MRRFSSDDLRNLADRQRRDNPLAPQRARNPAAYSVSRCEPVGLRDCPAKPSPKTVNSAGVPLDGGAMENNNQMK
jgi:hypothetical protein